MSDLISRADAIEAVAKLQKYDLDERNRLRIYAPWHKPKRIFVETEAIYKTIYTLPSADALLKQEIDFHKEVSRIEAEKVVDLEHKLAEAVSREFYEDAVKANIRIVRENRELKEQIESADAVQGEWIEYTDCEGKTRTITCSKCGWAEHSWVDLNYCPSCGTRMKGGAE